MADVITEAHLDLELRDAHFVAHGAVRLAAIWHGAIIFITVAIGWASDSGFAIVLGLGLTAALPIVVLDTRGQVLRLVADSSGRYRRTYRITESRLEEHGQGVSLGLDWTSLVRWHLSTAGLLVQTVGSAAIMLPVRSLPPDFIREIDSRLRQHGIPSQGGLTSIQKTIAVLFVLLFVLLIVLIAVS